MDKYRLFVLLVNCLEIMEEDFSYDFESLEENIGIDKDEYNKIKTLARGWFVREKILEALSE